MKCRPQRRWSALAIGLVVLATLAEVAPPAAAEPHPTHPGIVADQPVNYTPDVLDGHVSAFAQVGDLMIVAGKFSKVEQGGVVVRRSNIFAFSATTGALSTTFRPSVPKEVFDLQLTPDEQSVVLVGNFGSVNSTPGTSRIAQVRVADGTVDTGFVSPKPDDTVRDITWANGLYYVAGEFITVGGTSRRGVAALDADGADTGIVDLNIRGTNSGGQTKVQSMDITADGTQMVVAGNFASIDGLARGQLAVVDLTPSTATLSAWSTDRFAPECGPRFDTYMRDIAVDPAGAFFVVVTTGGPRGTQESGLLCDSASRWELGAQPDLQPTWINYTGGDTLTAAIVDTNVVYVGGHMRWLNNGYARNFAGPGAVKREGIAALDPANGLPYTWNPGRRRGYGVFGFALTDAGLWTGSDTPGFGGELRKRIAFCRSFAGTPLPRYITGTLPGDLVQLGVGTTADVVTQPFTGQQVGPVTALASAQDWTRSRGAFVVDGVLYSAWDRGTLKSQRFDGTTLGKSVLVNLRGTFAELPRVQTMFFDRTSRRIYYTTRGSTKLSYRYFQPQSRIIGSHRYTVNRPAALDWRQVAGAFAVGSRLFYVDRVSGNLRRVDWDSWSGATVGPPVDLVGPTLNGIDYRSASLVFLN